MREGRCHSRQTFETWPWPTFELGSTASGFIPVVDILYHDACIDAAKVGRDGNLEGKLLSQDTPYQVGEISEHPLYQEDGGKTVD